MTSKKPSRRLTDILRSNSVEALRRNAMELARVSASLPPDDLQTRFLRNMHLINPKSLRLLYDDDILSRWCVFAVYKPPFCPMRRSEAGGNYHHVSIESFIEASLRSRTLQPVLQRELRPEEVKVRVMNNLDMYASGPVVVTLSDRHAFSTSMKDVTMWYDVIVAGHAPLTGPHSVDVDKLFPPPHSRSAHGSVSENSKKGIHDTTMLSSSSSSSSSSCVCTYQVKRNAYYSVHPVSVIEFAITSPPTALPPRLEAYVRTHFGTFVLGDPDAPAAATTTKGGGGGEKKSTAGTADGAQAASAKMSWNVASMHGDCDFPRVFTHLRNVCIKADVADAAAGTTRGGGGGVSAKKNIEFHCNKCFEPILQRERIYSLKGRRIGLLDGSWTPESEFL